MAEMLCKNGYVDCDSVYNPSVYKRNNIYSWRSTCKTSRDQEINFIKEMKFNMQCGMMIVKPIDKNTYVLYSIATNKKNLSSLTGEYYALYEKNIKNITERGNYLYNSLTGLINFYTERDGITLPKKI